MYVYFFIISFLGNGNDNSHCKCSDSIQILQDRITKLENMLKTQEFKTLEKKVTGLCNTVSILQVLAFLYYTGLHNRVFLLYKKTAHFNKVKHFLDPSATMGPKKFMRILNIRKESRNYLDELPKALFRK